MKVLVTGVAGQLGYDVMARLAKLNIEAVGVDKDDFDLTDESAVLAYVLNCKPDVIVHCAAYTAVDRAEENVDLCMAVNGQGTQHLVRAARAVDAKLVYISTDYVFPGIGDQPYEADDPTGPKNVYGLSKLQGEIAVRTGMEKYFILRTSWVFGRNGNNFIKTMFNLGKTREEVRVVDDQIGSPTCTVDLAKLICEMIATEEYGIYHATNQGMLSWAQLAQMIMNLSGSNCKVIPIPSSEYPTPAKRPLNSRLSPTSLKKHGFPLMRSVDKAVTDYVAFLQKEWEKQQEKLQKQQDKMLQMTGKHPGKGNR